MIIDFFVSVTDTQRNDKNMFNEWDQFTLCLMINKNLIEPCSWWFWWFWLSLQNFTSRYQHRSCIQSIPFFILICCRNITFRLLSWNSAKANVVLLNWIDSGRTPDLIGLNNLISVFFFLFYQSIDWSRTLFFYDDAKPVQDKNQFDRNNFINLTNVFLILKKRSFSTNKTINVGSVKSRIGKRKTYLQIDNQMWMLLSWDLNQIQQSRGHMVRWPMIYSI